MSRNERPEAMDDERPDLSHMSTKDLVTLMLSLGWSKEPSDKAFAQFCRDEITNRHDTGADR